MDNCKLRKLSDEKRLIGCVACRTGTIDDADSQGDFISDSDELFKAMQ